MITSICSTLGFNLSFRTCAIVATLSSCVVVGCVCGMSSDLKYTTVCKSMSCCLKDLDSALFVLAAGSDFLTHWDANDTSPHACTELEVDLRDATISLAKTASGHACNPVY